MTPMDFWNRLHAAVVNDEPGVLIVLADRQGSAPNAPGAKMLIQALDGAVGTVGGGLSEFQLVNQARDMINDRACEIRYVHLNHCEGAGQNASGMICNGEQTFLLVPLACLERDSMDRLLTGVKQGGTGVLTLNSETGLSFHSETVARSEITFSGTQRRWEYREALGPSDTVYMIGGGHVSLALSEVLARLNFRLVVVDDREPMPDTMAHNSYVHQKITVNYSQIDQVVLEGPTSFAVIMTFGHVSDGLVLSKLAGRRLRYLGLMGSKSKVDTLFKKLEKQGIAPADLKRVFAPVGVPIKSNTPAEIAISIAAQLITTRNALSVV